MRALQTWKREGRGTLWLSCNFTRQSIADEKILARVREIIEQYDFTRDCLVVELTEDSYARDRETALRTIEGLHAWGFASCWTISARAIPRSPT